MDKIRVVLADDHFVVRNGIKTLIDGSEIEIIGEANNGVEAVEAVKKLSPDVVLMDISMPQMNGLDATEIISKQYKNSKSLILSMYDNEEYILSAVEAGALGYLLKDAPREEILKAIRTVAKGEKYFNSSISNIIINGYLKVKKSAISELEVKVKLSKKEMIILKQIVEGLNSRQIADKLELSIRTVDNHRANMMKKLSVRNAAELVKYAIEKKIF
jgi:DNA-binding NarL/FixJ family response regulator